MLRFFKHVFFILVWRILIVVTGRTIWSANLPESLPRLSEARRLYCEHKDWKTCQGPKNSAHALWYHGGVLKSVIPVYKLLNVPCAILSGSRIWAVVVLKSFMSCNCSHIAHVFLTCTKKRWSHENDMLLFVFYHENVWASVALILSMSSDCSHIAHMFFTYPKEMITWQWTLETSFAADKCRCLCSCF